MVHRYLGQQGLIAVGFLLLQGLLPWNPEHMEGMSCDLAFNTAASFMTNTNWQTCSAEGVRDNVPHGTVFILPFRRRRSVQMNKPNSMPIIVASARSEDKDKIEALDAGADDYLPRPSAWMSCWPACGWRCAAGCAYRGGEELHLTPIEYKLLCLLARNVEKVLTHNYILKEVWGSALSTHTPPLRVFMATLRKKIEPVPSQPRYIQTHVGVGYRMLRVTANEDRAAT